MSNIYRDTDLLSNRTNESVDKKYNACKYIVVRETLLTFESSFNQIMLLALLRTRRGNAGNAMRLWLDSNQTSTSSRREVIAINCLYHKIFVVICVYTTSTITTKYLQSCRIHFNLIYSMKFNIIIFIVILRERGMQFCIFYSIIIVFAVKQCTLVECDTIDKNICTDLG